MHCDPFDEVLRPAPHPVYAQLRALRRCLGSRPGRRTFRSARPVSPGKRLRDAADFNEPGCVDVARKPRTLSFGNGTHVCLGQDAAKLEARIMYEELLARVPARSEFVDGDLKMPIEFEPRERT